MYAKCGSPIKALDLWDELQKKNIQLSNITYVAILSACASIGPPALHVGDYILHYFCPLFTSSRQISVLPFPFLSPNYT